MQLIFVGIKCRDSRKVSPEWHIATVVNDSTSWLGARKPPVYGRLVVAPQAIATWRGEMMLSPGEQVGASHLGFS